MHWTHTSGKMHTLQNAWTAVLKAFTHQMQHKNMTWNAQCLDVKSLDQNSSHQPWHEFATETSFRQRFDRTQQFWVPSSLQSIDREGELHLLVEELTLDHDQFWIYYRMLVGWALLRMLVFKIVVFKISRSFVTWMMSLLAVVADVVREGHDICSIQPFAFTFVHSTEVE